MIEKTGPTIYKTPTVYKQIVDLSYKIIGGRDYKTVIMPDGKEWLAENLDFRFCQIGGPGTTTPKAWYYDNDAITYGVNGSKNCGLLYNWHAVNYLNENRELLCPGWHVASRDEWNNLLNAVGGAAVAGEKLKAIDGSISSIFPSAWNGTDEFNFGFLPAGYFNGSSNTFNLIGTAAGTWTATERNATDAHLVDFTTSQNASPAFYLKIMGYAIRLVRD